MFFRWPEYLWLMLVVPLLPVVYVWLLGRRGELAVRYTSRAVVRAAAVGRNWHRHMSPGLLLVACSALLLAAARPVASVPLPWVRSTSILAMNVSLSISAPRERATVLAAEAFMPCWDAPF